MDLSVVGPKKAHTLNADYTRDFQSQSKNKILWLSRVLFTAAKTSRVMTLILSQARRLLLSV